QSSPNDQSDQTGIAQEQANAVAQEKGENHASQGDQGSCRTYAKETSQIRFQADLKEQEDDAEFGQCVQDRIVSVDQPQHGAPRDHSRGQFTQNGRLPQLDSDLPENTGKDEEQGELSEQV